MINRLKAVLHLLRKYPAGYEGGEVDQISRSRRYLLCQLNDAQQSYEWFIVDEYSPGYGKIAAVQDLGSEFLIYRKFGFLHKYALLYLQAELVELQEDLERLDRREFNFGDPKNLTSRSRDCVVGNPKRKKLVAKLSTKLKQYGMLQAQC